MLNKQQKSILDRYNTSNKYGLMDCYKSCSHYKTRAEHLIKQEMLDRNGWGYKILSYNTNCFTCAYTYKNEFDELVLVYHTAYKRQEFAI